MEKKLLLIALVLSLTAWRADAQLGSELPGVHGMLVLGSESIYVSHLPMFTDKHRYQGIWEVSFGEEADKVYRTERARPENAKQIFTLKPTELFRLPELLRMRLTFQADVIRGHFERKGNRILRDVTVTIKQPAHWHPFRSRHERPDSLTYILFGKGDELFLAHWISAAPSYDQIVSVTPSVPLADIPEGAQFVLPKRSDGEALQAGESVSGLMIVSRGEEEAFRVKPVDLKVGSVIYLEKGELAESDLVD
jgi:hypothetical protein